MSNFETGLNPQVKVFSQVAAKVDSGGELWLQQMRQRAKTAKRKQRSAKPQVSVPQEKAHAVAL